MEQLFTFRQKIIMDLISLLYYMNECPRCGRSFTEKVEVCPTCGFSDENQDGTKSKKPTLAAVFMILSGVMAMLLALTIFMGDTSQMIERVSSVMNDEHSASMFELLLNVCTAAILFIAALEFVGAYLAFNRRNKFAVMITAFIGIFSVGIMFASSIFSILAIILIVTSEDDFV